MSICGNIASLGGELLFDLLLDAGLQGTLTIYGPEGSLPLCLQGDLILLPLSGTPVPGGERRDHRQRANRTLCRALSWRWASFEFVPGRQAAGVLPRGALILRPARLRAALGELRRVRSRVGATPLRSLEGFPLKGELSGVGLPAVLRALTQHERSGTLLVHSSRGAASLYLCSGLLFALERSRLPEWLVDVEAERERQVARLLACCQGAGASFTFLPGQLPSTFTHPPLGVLRVPIPESRLPAAVAPASEGARAAAGRVSARLAVA